MKKILLLIITFSVFFCLQGIAQKKARVAEDGRVSNSSTFKGKRALKKEKRIHKNASTVTASNAKAARKRNAKGGLPRSSRKPSKNKEKGKSVVIEEKKLAQAEPTKD
jgi:hypothetical protein